MIEYEKKGFASPFDEQPDTQQAGAWQPDNKTVKTLPPPYPPPYTPPYTPPPYIQPQYIRPPYAGPYMQQGPYGQQYGQPMGPLPPPGPGYGPLPYSHYAQAQYGKQAAMPKRTKEKKHNEKRGGLGIGRKNTAILVAIIFAACAISGICGGLIGADLNKVQTIVTETGPAISIEPVENLTTTEAVAKKVLASVVGITSTGMLSMDDYYFGPIEGEVTGVGTGMIIDSRGYILTNSHVVMDGKVDSIKVLLSDGDEVDGKLIWNDMGLDIAIIKVEANDLSPIELGNSDDVLIGSYVAAIGNPLGLEFSGSVTSGVVSGLNRTIQVSDGMGGSMTTMQGLIQVDAAINNGNSGGPLLNSKGQVIGVNTAKATAEGMGFAIPINPVIPIVEKVIRDGSFERVFMGVSAMDVKDVKERFPKVELKVESGACIIEINPGSPAEKGGLKVKDVIIAVDGKEINGSDSLIKMLLGYESGDVISVTYDRDGDTLETKVTLLAQSELEKVQEEENPFKEPQRGNSGR